MKKEMSDKELCGFYSRMASQLNRDLKDSFVIQCLEYKFKLQSFQKIGIDKTEIASLARCPHFDKHHKRILNVKDELKSQTIPRRECTKIIEIYDDGKEDITYELCSCLYLAHFD